MKPNYNQQRAERDRLKRARKEEKAREQEDARARRRAEQDAPATSQPAITEEPQA
jgi:hypothetical protein